MNRRVWWYKLGSLCRERLTGRVADMKEDESGRIRVWGDDGKTYRVRPSALRWE